MSNARKFAFAPRSRVNGQNSEDWVPVHGSQVSVEAAAMMAGWDARGRGGPRWFAKGDQMVFVEFGVRGQVVNANHGPAALAGDQIKKVEGKDKAGQIVKLLKEEG